MRELFKLLMAITAAVTVSHSTPADASFSVAGQAAWDDLHVVTVNVTGYATVAETGDYANLTGTPSIPSIADAWPIGSVYMSTRSTTPATILGFGTWTAIEGKFVAGVKAGDAEFGAGVSGGATGAAFTPSGTNAVVQFQPSGTNAVSLFREAAAGSNAASQVSVSVSVEWPTGVPVFAGTAATVTSSVNWPAGVPTFSGTGHQHQLPIVHTDNTVLRFLPTSTFGVGVSRAPDVKATVTNVLVPDTTSSGAVMLSQTVTAAGVIAWPASVPQAILSALPAGIITWPATAPSAVRVTGTAAAQVFTGVTGSVSGQVFTGITGTVSGQVFTGISRSIAILPPYLTLYMWERTA